jgi:acylphosphatase
VHAFFAGTVQGVGFRYTVQRTAGRFAVSGWVRNRGDGRVELQAEGTRAELESFIAAIEDAMRGYVERKDVTWIPADGTMRGFAIAPTV